MIIQTIDNINYKLREPQDFSWLSQYGEVFSVVDETGSGCICFGIRKDNKEYFFKIAGAKTVEAEISEEESIQLLKDCLHIYKDIHDDYLIKLIDEFPYKEFYVAIFEYVKGECLFDHWNFEKYKKDPSIITPKQRFFNLPIETKLQVAEKLCNFFIHTRQANYLAVDFYDSSIIYDFDLNEVHFCDVDLFRKEPTYNEVGENYFGTKRLKAPEENILNSPIDELTNQFTLAAIIFDMFSNVTNINARKQAKMFIPNSFDEFQLSKQTYDVLIKATSYEREKRFDSINEFKNQFFASIKK